MSRYSVAHGETWDGVRFSWPRPIERGAQSPVSIVTAPDSQGISNRQHSWLAIDFGQPSNFNRYEPLKQEPALFRKFIEMDRTPDGVVRFAEQFGMLGLLENNPLTPDQWGERFRDWLRCRRALADACDILDLARSRDLPRMVAEFEETPTEVLTKGRVSAFFGGDGFPIVSANDTPQLWNWWMTGKVNKHQRYRSLLQVCVMWTIDSWLGARPARTRLAQSAHAHPRLVWDDKGQSLRLVTVPSSLLSAMWLQLANELSGAALTKQCDGCGKWFGGEKGKRSNSSLCSDPSCKARARRKRLALSTTKRRGRR